MQQFPAWRIRPEQRSGSSLTTEISWRHAASVNPSCLSHQCHNGNFSHNCTLTFFECVGKPMGNNAPKVLAMLWVSFRTEIPHDHVSKLIDVVRWGFADEVLSLRVCDPPILIHEVVKQKINLSGSERARDISSSLVPQRKLLAQLPHVFANLSWERRLSLKQSRRVRETHCHR